MKFLISLSTIFLVFLNGFFANAQTLDSLDLSFKYYQGKGFEYESRIYVTENETRKAILFVQITNLSSSERDVAFSTSAHNDLDEKVPDQINYQKNQVLKGGETIHVQLEQELTDDQNWVFLAMRINNLMYPDLFLVGERFIFNSPSVFPAINGSQDITSTYFKKGDELTFNTFNNGVNVDSLLIYQLDYDFKPAYPPMFESFNQNEGGPENINSIKIGISQTFRFDSTGLYQYKESEESMEAQGFRVEESNFPKLQTVEGLIGPLRYISSNKEYNELDSLKSKKALDQFFLRAFGSPGRAKPKIKLYFNRVAKANYYFTNYKEGWKTDQGMLYIILGSPTNIKKDGNYEIWSYKKGLNSTLSFTFVQVKDPYSGYHFVLIRKDEYQNDWFKAIDTWRGR
ncbi:GWxTD domain-containing protein [Mangrovivirga sp. M17]|uniref:GWxTD domain-containing protein n=1 Tax=Mangrovivirga halotolerans TaxID=2993936 RepID=A0ABT3RNS9_9BACT|nr:GWxTD domain-containing protein [Mangrovivirga halotolerans]MCX2743434.1 GWxTD domain-containing protein [Mangrovivirga halotolerans]